MKSIASMKPFISLRWPSCSFHSSRRSSGSFMPSSFSVRASASSVAPGARFSTRTSAPFARIHFFARSIDVFRSLIGLLRIVEARVDRFRRLRKLRLHAFLADRAHLLHVEDDPARRPAQLEIDVGHLDEL